MRLINTNTLQLEDLTRSDVPPYAILSHTWGVEEVSFRDMSSGDPAGKQGYTKITNTCRLAKQQGLNYAWIDMCCIDKSSSAELTESINSMFQWYKQATICYVFLEDLPPGSRVLSHCRWFTRGWTLQELLAPTTIDFYDSSWNIVGSKFEFHDILVEITRIPCAVLVKSCSLAECSVAQKMSWAAGREIARLEDTAYCLLGLFDVNMSLIYGEGSRAFRRLQEEIIKRQSDMTIFAWEVPRNIHQQFIGALAESPAAFRNSGDIQMYSDSRVEFSVTNRGLCLSDDAGFLLTSQRDFNFVDTDHDESGDIMRCICVLVVGHMHGQGQNLGENFEDIAAIRLGKIGPSTFYRDGRSPLRGIVGNAAYKHLGNKLSLQNSYIQIDVDSRLPATVQGFRSHAIHVPFAHTHLVDAFPRHVWDPSDRVFLGHWPWIDSDKGMVLGLYYRLIDDATDIPLLVLSYYEEGRPRCKLLTRGMNRTAERIIFQRRNYSEPLLWVDLELLAPYVKNLSDYLEVRAESRIVSIQASFKKEVVREVSPNIEVYTLRLRVQEYRSDQVDDQSCPLSQGTNTQRRISSVL